MEVVRDPVTVRVQRASARIHARAGRSAGALVDAVVDAVCVRVARTSPRVHGRSRGRVRALIDSVRNVIAVRVDRTARGVHLGAARRVGALVLLVPHAVVILVAARSTERQLNAARVDEVVDALVVRGWRGIEFPDLVANLPAEGDAPSHAQLHAAAELEAVLVDVEGGGHALRGELLLVPSAEHVRIERDRGQEVQDEVRSVPLDLDVMARAEAACREQRISDSVLGVRLHPAVVALDPEIATEADPHTSTEEGLVVEIDVLRPIPVAPERGEVQVKSTRLASRDPGSGQRCDRNGRQHHQHPQRFHRFPLLERLKGDTLPLRVIVHGRG